MGVKIPDKLALFLSIVAVSPLILAAIIAIGIEYPLHRMKKSLLSIQANPNP